MQVIRNKKKKLESRRTLRKESTPQEIILWSRLRNKQLGVKFRRQHSIGNYIADFYCSEKHLVIELDGYQHNERAEYDKQRTKYLNSLNVKVIRFWNNEVNKNLEGVLLKILDEVKPPL